MKEGILAKRYIDAFCRMVATSDKEEMIQSLSHLLEVIYKHETLMSLLSSPLLGYEEKEQLLTPIFMRSGIHQHIQNFLLLIIKKDRFFLIKYLQEEADVRVIDAKNQLTIVVDTPAELNKDQTLNLVSFFEKESKKKIHLDVNVVPNMLGGFRATVGHVVYDGTLENGYEKLRLSFN